MATTRRQPSFFKVLIGYHFSEKLLGSGSSEVRNREKIPGAFLRRFNGEVPEQCHLKIRTQTWAVDIKSVNHKFYFQSGWKDFVHDNGLKACDFLVFSYKGNSEFSVLIYGKECCKKEFPEAAREERESLNMKYVGSSKDTAESDDESLQILDHFPTCLNRTGEKSPLPSYQAPRKNDSSSLSGKATNETMSKQSMKQKETHCSIPGIERKQKFAAEPYVGATSSSIRYEKPRLERMDIDDYDADVDDDREEEMSEEEKEDDCDEDEKSEEDDIEADSEDEDEEEERAGDEFESDDSIEILDEFQPCSKPKATRKPYWHNKQKTNSSKARAQCSKRRASGSSSYQKVTRWKVKVPKARTIRDHMATQRAYEFMSSSRRPSCSVTMSSSYIKGSCMHFPHGFSRRYLQGHSGDIQIRVNEKSWKLRLHSVNETIRIQAGWIQFKRENKLKEGDICVFVAASIPYAFDVTIFRAAEAGNGTLPGRQTTGVQIKSRKGKEKVL